MNRGYENEIIYFAPGKNLVTADYGDIFEIFVKILKNKSCPRLPPRAPGTAVSGVLKKCRLEVKFFFHF